MAGSSQIKSGHDEWRGCSNMKGEISMPTKTDDQTPPDARDAEGDAMLVALRREIAIGMEQASAGDFSTLSIAEIAAEP
ncbi:MAG: hypothetical protein HQL40_16560 [Alphaproteobacteria bacterium]|nr:hypothetical protein [Alphaproteobacteria bacterium]